MSKTDYSKKQNFLRNGINLIKNTDIFVVYPTVVFTENEIPFVNSDNQKMRNSAEKWLTQFDDIFSQCNVFAPIYRQLNGFMLNKIPAKEMANTTNQTPRDDILAAFDYYLKEINKNERPFILFGHSQGSQLVMELATTFLGSEKYHKYNKNHIATYAIGLPVSQKEIDKNPYLKFSERKDDFGVIVSWNCAGKNENPQNFISWKDKVLVNNPLSWGTKANAEISVIEDREKGVLFIETDETKFHKTPPNISIFHTSEISFFKDAVKQNIKDRINAYYS